jgi:hypothetical protein
MKKLLWIGIGIVGLSVASVQAEEAAAPVAPQAPKVEKKANVRPELKDLTVVGTITKTEKQSKNGKTIARYTITGENGTTYNLRVPAKKEVPGANLPEFAGSKVKVVGKGQEGKHNIIAVIISIEKIDITAPAAAK